MNGKDFITTSRQISFITQKCFTKHLVNSNVKTKLNFNANLKYLMRILGNTFPGIKQDNSNKI